MRSAMAGSSQRWLGMVLCATIFLFPTTCSDSDPTSPTDPIGTEGLSFTIVSGDQQFWLAGYELPAPIVIMATDDKGKPVKNQLVNFRVTGGGGSVFAGSAVTDDDGIAQDYWALGTEPGPNTLEVRAVNPTTGEKHVYAQLHAEGLPGAADLQVIQELLNHMWIRALTESVELSSSDVAMALGTDFDQIVRNLEPAGVLSEVDEAMEDLEGLLATPERPNLVDYAFLAHVIRFCRNRFDAVMELIPTVSSTGG